MIFEAGCALPASFLNHQSSPGIVFAFIKQTFACFLTILKVLSFLKVPTPMATLQEPSAHPNPPAGSPAGPDPASPPAPQDQKPKHQPGTFQHLQIVIGVAFVLATLFTAWTPGGIISNPIEDLYSYESETGVTPSPRPTSGLTPTPRLRPLVGLVAGHWGNDSGATCDDGLTEAEINQNIASLVQKMLVEKGLDVEILQEFDSRLAGYQASALVSIHADSCDFINDAASGFKVAAALANLNPERSARLTACLRSRYAQATGLALHSTSVTIDMTSYHAFDEIASDTPAAIIEVGFMNLDRQLLTQSPGLPANGIVNGIMCFLNNESIPIGGTAPTTQPTVTVSDGQPPLDSPTILPSIEDRLAPGLPTPQATP